MRRFASLACLVALLVGAPSCLGLQDDFTCATDDDCTRGDEQGVCERTNYCGFSDPACPWSKRRYGDYAAAYSGECVSTGATYWVSPNGDDMNAGTQAQPFRTIAHGTSVLAPGDVLLVGAGEYVESITEIPPGRSWSYPVTVASYPRRDATLRPPSSSERALEIVNEVQRYIVASGFVIDAAGGPDHGVVIGQDHVRIEDCEIENAPRTAVLVQGDPETLRGNEIVALDIHGNGAAIPDTDHGTPAGVSIAAEGNLVERCTIHDNNGVGIELYAPPGGAGHNTIRKNRLLDNGPHDGNGILVSSGEGALVYDNVMRGSSGSGISVDYGAINARILNNTIAWHANVAISIGSAAQGTIVANNIAYRDDASNGLVDVGVETKADHNITTDPLLVGVAAGDFHVRSGSPAIDSGATLSEVPDDFDGAPRPEGGGYDIGAYERAP